MQQINIDINHNRYSNMSNSLKESFLSILDNYLILHKPKKLILSEIYYRFDELFRTYNLPEFQYRIEFIDNKINFLPLREIDKLAFKGMMSENIRKEKIKRILDRRTSNQYQVIPIENVDIYRYRKEN